MKKCIFSMFVLFGTSTCFAQKVSSDQITTWTREKLPKAIQELDATLSIPNNALVPENVKQTLEWTHHAFEKRGFTQRELPTPGAPLLLAERKVKKAKKTVMFYMHLDGQPVDPSKWNQDSPYKPVIRKHVGTTWKDVSPLEQKNGFDDEWRIFARSASDDTGPVVMFLSAIDLLDAHNRSSNYNIKVIMDPEEEMGSPHLPDAVLKYADDLKADRLIIYDGPRHISNAPTLTFGARGIATITLTVFGPRVPQHSGHYGNYAPNPALELAQLVGGMKDAGGKVVIPGFYDGVNLTADVKQLLSAVPDNEKTIRKNLGIRSIDNVGASYQEALQYPSLNIRGINSGWVGPASRTIIPATATAEIDIRLVVESKGPRLINLVKNYAIQQGFHIINGSQPTEGERMNYDKLLYFSSTYSYPAFRTPILSDMGEWLNGAMKLAFGHDPIKIRTSGGSVPISPFVSTLNIPAVTVPTVNRDNNQHSPNENLRIGNFREGIMTITTILATPYK